MIYFIDFICVLQELHWSELVASSDREQDEILISEIERKRREAVWELFRCECVFLIDYLMVLKHVSTSCMYHGSCVFLREGQHLNSIFKS